MFARKFPHVVLLDRDGVINEDLVTSVCTTEQFTFIHGSVSAIVALNRAGFEVIVITNQACIGRGDTTGAAVAKIHQQMISTIARHGGKITDIFLCPHTPSACCTCRKPLPGLLYEARDAYQFELTTTWFVGDSQRDIVAAQKAGCIPALVLTGRGAETKEKVEGIQVFDDLKGFADYLIGQHLAGKMNRLGC